MAVKNAFEMLGLPVCLGFEEDEIRAAFRKNAGDSHPDSGGDPEEFARLQSAEKTLLSPVGRLREWLKVHGVDSTARGTISSSVMDRFQRVAEVGNAAEAAIAKGDAATTALTRALAEVELMKQRDEVKEMLAEIGEEIQLRVKSFGQLEEDFEEAAVLLRELTFLEKWQVTLKALYGRLL